MGWSDFRINRNYFNDYQGGMMHSTYEHNSNLQPMYRVCVVKGRGAWVL